jgi:hypothetical protein
MFKSAAVKNETLSMLLNFATKMYSRIREATKAHAKLSDENKSKSEFPEKTLWTIAGI